MNKKEAKCRIYGVKGDKTGGRNYEGKVDEGKVDFPPTMFFGPHFLKFLRPFGFVR